MSVLNRYLLRRNMFFLLSMLMAGAGIYVLSDLFQSLDNFLEAGYGPLEVAFYYLLRLPMIISTILPAVFLLSLATQLALMHRQRETTALRAGGLSPRVIFSFVLLYGLFWSCAQFACAQLLGIQGERLAGALWDEDIKKKNALDYTMEDLLFISGDYVVRANTAWPHREEAAGVIVYKLSPDRLALLEAHSAARARSGKRGWTLFAVESVFPAAFKSGRAAELPLDIRHDLASFKNTVSYNKSADMDMDELRAALERLELAGANVEMLRTDYYGRYAYAGSILVMGLTAMFITLLTERLYAAVLLSLLGNFLFFAVSSFSASLGQGGSLQPIFAAWGGNIIFAFLALSGISYRTLRAGGAL